MGAGTPVTRRGYYFRFGESSRGACAKVHDFIGHFRVLDPVMSAKPAPSIGLARA
jgi:hypothetical protein